MKVNIGVLKNKLSHYLRHIRQGNEITVTDRNEPIAKIIPLDRPFTKSNFKKWLQKHPPIQTHKKQPPSGAFIRKIRDEEE